jgi:hypothetical protein
VEGRMTTRMFALVARRILAYAGPVVVSAIILAGLASATQARMLGAVAPLARVALAGAAASIGVAIGAGVLAGAAATARSLARGAGWSVLRGSGSRGRDVLRAAVLPLALLASLQALAEHALAPRARAWAHAHGAPGDGALTPPVGTTLRVGDLAVAADACRGCRTAVASGEALHLAWGRRPAEAWTGRAEAVVLADGSLRAHGVTLEVPGGGLLRARELRVPIPARADAVPIAARTTGALLASTDPYARWNGVKRAVLPACSGLLAAGLLALGLRAPWLPALLPVAGATGLVWALVRALDGWVRAEALGVGGAAAALLLVAALAPVAAWCRWRDG